MNVLVDTSVWSLALRRKSHNLSAAERTVAAELAELIREDRARIIDMVRQELLSGIRTPSEYEDLRASLRDFPDEPVDTSDHEAAAKASNTCRSRGVKASPVDSLICQVALARRWAIFTTDPDFGHYAKILPLTLHSCRT